MEGYIYNKVEGVFEDFVKNINDIKTNPKDPGEKQIAKLIMNSVIGRFGMDPIKNVSNLVDKFQHDFLMATHKVINTEMISKDLYLDTYIPIIDKDICFKSGYDYF